MTISPVNNAGKKEIRASFSDKQWKEALTFVIFILVAFGFWMLQYLQQKFEQELAIPVQYEHLPSAYALDDSLISEIKIKVSDKGTALLSYSFGKQSAPVKIDLRNLSPDRCFESIPKELLTKEIIKNLPSTTNLLSHFPESISVKYHPLMRKKLPVTLNGKLELLSGFMLVDGLHFTPDSVWAYGNETMLNSLQKISTEKVELKKSEKSIDIDLQLLVPPGVSLSSTHTSLFAGVEEFTEKTILLPVTCSGIPEGYVVRFFPSSVELTCQLSLNDYKSLTEADIDIGVDYTQIVHSRKMSTPLFLLRRPDWLKHYKVSPENVEYLIEKKTK